MQWVNIVIISNKNIKLIDKIYVWKYYPNKQSIENSSLRLKFFPKHIKIYDTKRNKLELSSLNNNFEIKATIQCHSIWLSKDNYGLTWIAKSFKIKPKKDLAKEALFS